MSINVTLTNLERALIILFVLMVTPVLTWVGLGFPTDKAAVGLVIAAEITAGINFANDLLGNPKAAALPAPAK